MGGSAFEGTVRMSRSELERMRMLVVNAINVPIAMPPQLSSKLTFGDLDLHCQCSGEMKLSVRQRVMAVVESIVPAVGSNNIWSILSKENYQIDLEFYTEGFKFSLAAKGNGDMMWLVNLSLADVGVKITEEGLYVRKLSPLVFNLSEDLLLSNEPTVVAEVLGLDKTEFDGISCLSEDQVFEAAVKCKYFNVENFEKFHDTALDNCDGRRRLTYCGVKNQLESLIDQDKLFREELTYKNLCKHQLSGSVLTKKYPHAKGPDIGAALVVLRGTGWKQCAQWLETATVEQVDMAIDHAMQQVLNASASAMGKLESSVNEINFQS